MENETNESLKWWTAHLRKLENQKIEIEYQIEVAKGKIKFYSSEDQNVP